MIGGFIAVYYSPRGLGRPLQRNDGTNGSGIIGTGSPRCGDNGVTIHAPTQVSIRISGLYQSILPDGQVASVTWDDGSMTKDYSDGSEVGLCDTILSANLLSLVDGGVINWDLHALSETDNDIGHGDAQDNLGMGQCTSRIYSLFIKNRADSEADMIIGGAATNEWTPLLDSGAKISMPPDSIFALIGENQSGILVSESNCNLKIEADGIGGGDLLYGLNWNGCSV